MMPWSSAVDGDAAAARVGRRFFCSCCGEVESVEQAGDQALVEVADDLGGFGAERAEWAV